MTKGASSRHGGRNRRKGAPTGKTSKASPKAASPKSGSQGGTDWNKLRRLSSTAIRNAINSDADARATDVAFWKDAKVVLPARKAVVTMRLDSDLLEWFREQRGYQTRINAILRAYMRAQASGPRG